MEILLIIIVIIVIGYFALKKFESFKGKTIEELEAMLSESSNHLFYRNALIELSRRNHDIAKYKYLFPPMMESDDKTTRIRGWSSYMAIYKDSSKKYELSLTATLDEYKSIADKIRNEIKSV